MTREPHDRNEWVDEPCYPTPEAKARALRRTALGCLIGWTIALGVLLYIIAAMGCQPTAHAALIPARLHLLYPVPRVTLA